MGLTPETWMWLLPYLTTVKAVGTMIGGAIVAILFIIAWIPMHRLYLRSKPDHRGELINCLFAENNRLRTQLKSHEREAAAIK